MRDDWFERSLVLLCQHDEDGAIGLVINREGDIPIQEVMERLASEHGEMGHIPDGIRKTWWGGPVGDGAGFVVYPGEVRDGEGWNIGGVAVSPSVERLAQLVRSGQGFNLCLGYAGWGPGQLASEIELGSWLAVDVDPEIVFDTPIEERYEKALALLGLTPQSIWMTPINE
ncbi:MAG: YqgE/AlgH family protein [Myxococcota bacterium]